MQAMFRASAFATGCWTFARRWAVTGYVQNLPDGQVHLVAEGDPSELDAFLAAVHQRMQDHIRDTRQDRRPATGQFRGFELRVGG